MSLKGMSLAVAILAAGSWPTSASAQVPRGREFQVNTFTIGNQREAAVAARADGDFLVVWRSPHPGSVDDIFGRLYDASGVPLGPEFRVNEHTANNQGYPGVAAIGAGRFVVLWAGSGYDDASGVFGRVVDAQGQPTGDDFRINTYTTGTQSNPAVASGVDGRFVVAWFGAGSQDFDGVFARRFDSSAVAQGGQFVVNTSRAGLQAQPAVALRAQGEFFVLWSGAGQPDPTGVHMQRFTSSGAFGPEMQINGYMTGNQSNPAIAAEPGGDMFLAWESQDQDGNLAGAFGRRIDASTGIHEEFRVNSHTTSNQQRPSVASDAAGNFVAVWSSFAQDGSLSGVFGQRYDASFDRSGPEFQVNTRTWDTQAEPAVASDPAGNWMVVWTSRGSQDGDGDGVFAQMYAPDVIFDDGFDNGNASAWSLANTDGGDLSVTASATLRGYYGLRAVVDDTAGLWVQDSRPLDEARYRARFYFDPNGFDPGEALDHRRVQVFIAFEEDPVRRLIMVVLRRLNGAYSVRGSVRLDDHSLSQSPFFPISDGPHFVELDWRRSSGPDAEDGEFSFWLDGSLVHTASGLDNSLSAVDFVRLGVMTVKVGAAGTVYLDAFASRRESPIGF